MNIFIDKQQFESHIFFDLKKDDNENICGFKTSENGRFKLSFKFKGRDFESMSKIIENSSIVNSFDGKPFLRTSIFIKSIFLAYIFEISIIEEDSVQKFIVNEELLNKLHYDFVKIIVSKWLNLTGGA